MSKYLTAKYVANYRLRKRQASLLRPVEGEAVRQRRRIEAEQDGGDQVIEVSAVTNPSIGCDSGEFIHDYTTDKQIDHWLLVSLTKVIL